MPIKLIHTYVILGMCLGCTLLFSPFPPIMLTRTVINAKCKAVELYKLITKVLKNMYCN